MELSSRLSAGVYNFEVTLRLLENLCIAVLGSVSCRGGVLIHLRQASDKSTQRFISIINVWRAHNLSNDTLLFPHLLTYPMEQSPSREANQ